MSGVREFPVIVPGDGSPLPEWITANRAALRKTLRDSGAVLLRGFPVTDLAEFERARNAVLDSSARYVEAATPRRQLAEHVFSSTEFPASESIALHNENSYALSWPGILLFGCLTAPETGGATPVADVREVLARLSPGLVRAFEDRGGWLLQRNYGPWFGLDWRTAFGTSSRDEVEEYCRRADVHHEWIDGETLRTRQVRPVVARHPTTGEAVWFNHARFWHTSFLPAESRELMEEEFGPGGLPYSTWYGDGSPIPDEVAAEIDEAYRAARVAVPWRVGDVLVIDNMLTAHGREAFTGPRRVVVAMGEPVEAGQR